MIGNTILHYKILEKLGEGGMGVVYKALDTKLDREVALKFLPTNTISSKEEKARFEQEAKAAARLSHANIAHVYEINEHEGRTYIAMEFIDGETLSDLIESRPLKLKDAIKIARQIAEGMHSAHEQGVVHRDIKSSNIMITANGTVKIMDFGLAKVSKASMVTKAGTTLGTISYMSPEQAQGEKVDHRSDIWSLGVVLYEMISGQMPFKGDYESAIIYSIMNEAPEPLTAVRTGVPMKLEEIVNKLLAKDPDERYQNIIELPVDLKNVSVQEHDTSGIGSTVIPSSINKKENTSRKRLVPTLIIIATVLGVGQAIALILLTTGKSYKPLPLTASLYFEEDTGPAVSGIGRGFVLSPDGTELAFVPELTFDGGRLRIRDLADGTTMSLSGTEGAKLPFWSPDGSMIGYFSGDKLRIVPAKGGPSIALATAPRPAGGTWNSQGVILYNPALGPLFQIPAAGGTPAQVTQPRYQGDQHRSPVFLPDGRHFLFFVFDFGTDNNTNIYKGDLETGEIELIREGGAPEYVEPGFLVFRLGNDLTVASLFAQRFDPERGILSGQPLPVLSNFRTPGGNSQLSVTSRTIVFVPSSRGKGNPPILMSRKGVVIDTLAHREGGWAHRFSPDGGRVAIAGRELWVHDLARKISERIPTEVYFPTPFAWSSDGTSIVYSSYRVSGELRKVMVTGTGKEAAIFKSEANDIYSISCSSDSRTILFVYAADEAHTHSELWACDVRKGTASRVLDGAFNVFTAKFAPNGKWYAYTSDEGRNESDIYLRPFPGPGTPIRVSADGGTMPNWRKDGKELFYINGEDQLVAVQVNFEGGPSVSPARFVLPDAILANSSPRFRFLDAHPDGQSFLLQEDEGTSRGTRLTIIRDWLGMLEEPE